MEVSLCRRLGALLTESTVIFRPMQKAHALVGSAGNINPWVATGFKESHTYHTRVG